MKIGILGTGVVGQTIGRKLIDRGITAARGTEMLLPLWLRLYGNLKTGYFNLHVAK